jgi:hypothetical protein
VQVAALRDIVIGVPMILVLRLRPMGSYRKSAATPHPGAVGIDLW